MAHAIVVYYGMSDALPNVSYYDSTGQAYGFSKPYGGDRAAKIDAEISRIINEQYQRAKDIISAHADGHAKLAETLLTKEVMFAEDLKEIFGPRQWASRTEEIMRLQAELDAKRQADKKDTPDVEDVDATEVGSDSTPKASPDANGDTASKASPEADGKPTEVPPVPASSDASPKAPPTPPTPPPFNPENK